MDSENKFWLGIWIIVLLAFMTFTLSIAFYNINQTNKINDLIKNGTTPAEAACALENNSQQLLCMTAVLQTKGK